MDRERLPLARRPTVGVGISTGYPQGEHAGCLGRMNDAKDYGTWNLEAEGGIQPAPEPAIVALGWGAGAEGV